MGKECVSAEMWKIGLKEKWSRESMHTHSQRLRRLYNNSEREGRSHAQKYRPEPVGGGWKNANFHATDADDTNERTEMRKDGCAQRIGALPSLTSPQDSLYPVQQKGGGSRVRKCPSSRVRGAAKGNGARILGRNGGW